jgi:hypothetical protein
MAGLYVDDDAVRQFPRFGDDRLQVRPIRVAR